MVLVALSGILSADTPAFQEYARYTVTTNAKIVGAKLQLDTNYMTTTNIQYIFNPSVSGIDGGVVFGGRYYFGGPAGKFGGFVDRFCEPGPPSVPHNAEMSKFGRRGHTPNVSLSSMPLNSAECGLTVKQALRIASHTMEQLGVSEKAGLYGKPKIAQRMTETTSDGNTYQLPLYHFEWQTDSGYTDIDVSCVTSNVAMLRFQPPLFKFFLPKNYFELLDLPAHPVFVTPLHPGQKGPPYRLLMPQIYLP